MLPVHIIDRPGGNIYTVTVTGILRNFFVSIIVLFSCAATARAADPLRRSNERTVFSFRLKNSGKYVSILESTDKRKPYLVYRFGTADAVELEIPRNKEESWSRFSYWYYLRGGGPQNEGLDLNYLGFTNNGWEYIIYDEYTAVGDQYEAGVLVVRLQDCKVTELVGRADSSIGSLVQLRGNDALRKDDSIPDERCQEKLGR